MNEQTAPEMARALISEAVQRVPHERVRVAVAGLSAYPTDDQWKLINAVEGLILTAVVTVELSGEVPELNRLASSGSGRRPTGQMLTQVPRVGPHPDPSVSHPELVAGLKECIEDWMTLNTDTWLREPEELAARVLVWLAQREWCECPAFPGIVRERDLLDARLAETTASRVRVVEFLKRLRSDLIDDADMIGNGYGMISAAWVASHMRHIARYGHRMPRKAERPHIHHDGDAAILNATAPAGSPTVAVGMTSEPTRCPVRYERPGVRQPDDRIVKCNLGAGHSGAHEEAETGVTWPQTITDHAFEPYRWEKNRCGYLNGDDEMCGYPLFAHDATPWSPAEPAQEER